MFKTEIRKKYMQKRKALSEDEVFTLSNKIFNNFIEYFKPVCGQKVHIFIPIEKFTEVRTEIFTDYFFLNKLQVFVPKVTDEKLISVEIFPNSPFKISSWGISEPVSDDDSGILNFDFIITPLLYCDKDGNRVGYGKGFYDVFFENVSKDSTKIGINYFSPEDFVDDVNESDIPLDYLVTPTEVLSFLKGGV